MKKFNLEGLNLTELNNHDLLDVSGGIVGAPTWKQIWNNAYDGNWAGAIGGVGDKIEQFFN
jgi:hypothetical protein